MSMKYLENMCYHNEINGFNLNNKSTILLNSSVDLTKYYPVNTQKIPIDFNLENKIRIKDFKQTLEIHLDNILNDESLIMRQMVQYHLIEKQQLLMLNIEE